MQTKVIRWFCCLAVDSLCPWAEAGGWGCPLSPCVTLVGAKRRELCSCSAAFDGAAASDRVFGAALKAVSKRTRSEQVSFPLSLCYVNAHLHHVSLFPLSGSGVWAPRSVGLGPAPLEPQPRVLARALRGTAQCSPLWQGLVCHSLHKTWGKSGTSRSKLQIIQELQTQECWDLNLSVTEASYCRMGFCEVAPRTVDWSSSGRGYGGDEEKMQCLEQMFNFSNCVQGLQGN